MKQRSPALTSEQEWEEEEEERVGGGEEERRRVGVHEIVSHSTDSGKTLKISTITSTVVPPDFLLSRSRRYQPTTSESKRGIKG